MVRARLLPRFAALAGLAAAALLGSVALAPAAFAHHPDISGSSACDTTVTFSSTAWVAGSPAERTNPTIAIAYATDGGGYTTLAQKAAYRFDAAGGFTFTDMFTPPVGWTSLTLRATATASWADGAAAGDTRTSSTITPATGCTPTTTAPPATTPTTTPPTTPTTVTAPAAPSVTVESNCTGPAVVHLVNSGGEPVDLTVDDGTTPPTIVTVAAHGQTDVPVRTGATTVTVTAPGMSPVTHQIAVCASSVAPAQVLDASATAAPPARTTAASATLPRTGAPTLELAVLASFAVLAGLALVGTTRRRHTA